ncbi:MAG TPA: tetratricopeptide repeat protein [Thermomicrobiales bacterium]|nr:tetratricopeptide repeat protein [Thermomicrobiales bacterium]
MAAERDLRLAEGVRLRESGSAEEARPLLIALAAELPDDAEVQYQAAWVHDFLGLEEDAVPYYERALALGLAEPEMEGLVLGLGSTYRNVERIGDSLALLERGVRDYPANHAMRCFLALSRLSNGESGEALALAFDVILDTSVDPSIERYWRALSSYREVLRDA